MKFCKILTMFFLLFSSVSIAQTTGRDTLLDYYYKYPQQALKEAEKLQVKATRTNNPLLLLQSLFLKTTFTLQIDKDAFPALSGEIQTYIHEEKDIPVKCILHSYLARLYSEYYYQNRHLINQRTIITDTIPDHIEVWSSNHFKQKILEQTAASIAPETCLSTTPFNKFRSSLYIPSSEDTLCPTLYDYLCHAALTLIPEAFDDIPDSVRMMPALLAPAETFIRAGIGGSITEGRSVRLTIWQKLLAFRLQAKEVPALILTDLQRLNYTRQIYSGPGRDSLLLTTLEEMREKQADSPFSVEIIAEEANLLNSSNNAIPFQSRIKPAPLIGNPKRAIALCKEGVLRFPGYARINLLHQIISNITEPQVGVICPRLVYPNEAFSLTVSSKNIKKVTITLSRIDTTLVAYLTAEQQKNIPETQIFQHTYPLGSSLLLQDTSFTLKGLPAGHYKISISTPGNNAHISDDFICTSLVGINQYFNGKHKIRVCDLISGKPVKNARINIYRYQYPEYKLLTSAHTNSEGLAQTTSQGDLYQVIDAKNPAGPLNYLASSNSRYEGQEVKRIELITDRKIYRPGQIVYYKGIAWVTSSDTLFADHNTPFTINFFDPNGKSIKEQKVKSNAFGSFSGSFVIPRQALNGYFRLTAGNYQAYIQVADYKRPAFEISFLAAEKNYYTGDTIRIQGKINNFSGTNPGNTLVKYQIQRVNLFYRQSSTSQNIQGSIMTRSNGEFEFTFVAREPASFSPFPQSYAYNITVSATDAKGETQEAQTQVPVYSGEPAPDLTTPEQVDKKVSTAFIISLQSIAPGSERQKVSYQISRIAPPSRLTYPVSFEDTVLVSTILQGELFMQEKDSIFPSLHNQPSGAYLWSVKSGKNKASRIFYLYSSDDKQPPIPTYSWLVPEKTTCHAGEKARILFGTSVSDAYIMYEIFSYQRLIKRGFITLSNEVKVFEIPYLAEYGDQIWLNLTYVRDKQFIQKIVPVKRIYNNRHLSLETKVFRDKLYPGQEEQWEIRILDEEGKPVHAEMLAMMYDASLDALAPNPVRLVAEHTYFPLYSSNWQFPYYSRKNYLPLLFKRKNYPVPPLQFCPVNDILTYPVFYMRDFSPSFQAAVKSAGPVITGYTEEKQAENSMRIRGSVAEEEGLSEISFRKNFEETAFFYPQLHTDSSGTVSFRFQVPESNTKWKFIALANTENMATGQTEAYITTNKPLMVSPNYPRFLRSGDCTELKVTVSNLSDTLQAGKARIEFFQPLTQEILYSSSENFSIPAGENATVTFTYPVPRQISLIGCRISALSGRFSDGEQQVLPVLPDELLVTATEPFYTSTPGEHTYSLPTGQEAGKSYRLTLEVTANPLWYAVLALPSLQESREENVTEIAAAYYINTIASAIARSNPKIVEAIRHWKTTHPETLQSPLEQDPELKSVLLSASPWALEAENETEQMQRLGSLFDLNRLGYLQSEALKKLSGLQQSGGGWSWFKGMPDSRFMTLNVLGIMSRATTTGQHQTGPREKEMQMKALRFLDAEIQKDYKNKPETITYGQILYLYIRGMYRDIPLGDALEAHKYFMALAKKQWGKFSLYEKAVTAIAFQQYGFEEEARHILRSLKEYARTTPEEGMFWPRNRNSYYRNSAVSVHSVIMEAFYTIEGNTKDTDMMKQWLLRQKQTQMWGNVPSTVDAIYALLLTGKEWLDTNDPISISLGKQHFTASSGTDPLGYIKKSYSDQEIQPDMLTVKIRKTSDTPTWGSLYLQYFDKLNQIKPQKNALSIDKKLFIEEADANGQNVLHTLEKRSLKIGDKVVVRLTLSIPRDMEFLHLQDLRAACFEPVEQLSGNQWKFGTVYYQDVKDAVTNFFFTSLARGTYVIEYPVWVNQAGEYQDGIACLQSIYAPEYNAYSQAGRVQVSTE